MSPSTTSSGGEARLTFHVHSNDVIMAELYWLFYSAHNNISFRASSSASQLFSKMFPDSKIAADVSMSRTKATYLVSHGVAPIFQKDVVNDIN